MNEITEAELQDLRRQWEAVKGAVDDAWDAIAETLYPAFEAIRQIALYFAEMVQRAYLCQSLPHWIPEVVRAWLARHWPRALLPELAGAIEWMEGRGDTARSARR